MPNFKVLGSLMLLAGAVAACEHTREVTEPSDMLIRADL